MDKISIIIPVYNVEPYIKKCLDSIINQTHTNLEILCINDGSTDSSGKICDEYAMKDNRIKVFHQHNQGVSAARNVGLNNFTGDYIGFVDSDDWIEPDMYETLYNLVKHNDVPVGVVNYFMDTDTQSLAMTNLKEIEAERITQENMLLYTFKREYYRGFNSILCNKILSSKIFNNRNLLFNERIEYGEDTLLCTMILLTQDCMGAYADKPLYHYYQRTSSALRINGSVDYKIEGLNIYKLIIKLLIKNGYNDVSIWVKRFYCYHASCVAEKAINNNDNTLLVKMQREIKKYLKEYIETNKQYPDRIERIYKILDS